MGRPPMIPPEKKTRIVLAILAGEMSIAETARKEKVSEQSLGRWKAEFIEAGKTALVAGRSGPSSREEQLEAEVVELTQALGEAHVELRVWKKSAEGRLGPSRTRLNSSHTVISYAVFCLKKKKRNSLSQLFLKKKNKLKLRIAPLTYASI